MATGFLPVLGVDFAWVLIHWVAGLVLSAAIVFHMVRALFWLDIGSMWIGLRDLRDGLVLAKWNLRLSGDPPPLGGKYSLAQKLIHHAFTLVLLVVAVTGCLMLVKIDAPWWERDPYWLDQSTWGVIYVLHDLTALLLITMVMAHVYFALRPEKLHFTRSMILGWITRGEYTRNHDPERWRVGSD
jgi:cytochrome b subunit of formate dehydrogenase